jgi:hypothetical protein
MFYMYSWGLNMGDRFSFVTHLSQKINKFVMAQLNLGLLVC